MSSYFLQWCLLSSAPNCLLHRTSWQHLTASSGTQCCSSLHTQQSTRPSCVSGASYFLEPLNCSGTSPPGSTPFSDRCHPHCVYRHPHSLPQCSYPHSLPHCSYLAPTSVATHTCPWCLNIDFTLGPELEDLGVGVHRIESRSRSRSAELWIRQLIELHHRLEALCGAPGAPPSIDRSPDESAEEPDLRCNCSVGIQLLCAHGLLRER